MKILHVITTINRGGAENHLKDLIELQIKTGNYEVSCAYLKGDAYWKEYLESIGCDVFCLDMNKYGDVLPVAKLRKYIQEKQPDILHAHLAPAELYARLALLMCDGNIKMIISRHNHHRFYEGIAADWVERWVVTRASRFIGISESVREHFSREMPSIASKFDCVPYGINTRPFEDVPQDIIDSARAQWSVDPDTLLFGTVARLVEVKGLHTLIDGFSQALKKIDSKKVKLVIVGAGPLEADLKSQANRLGVDENIIWAGFREDIPVVMNAIDVFVLTSLSEGFGLVLLEAMSSSRPVISTNVSALPEIVVDGETGILIPPGSPASLSEAMMKYYDNRSLVNLHGKAGLLRAKSKFGLDVMFERTDSVYRCALGIMR